ncbi:MAG: phosphotransferase, partial [Gammaproteobacteria bacterium]
MNSKPPALPRSLAELFTRWSPPGSAGGLPQLEAVFSAGHSNRNFLLRQGECRFVVRLPDRAAERLGVDRHVESRVLDCVSGLGFGPEVLLCEPESGVLVTRYLESRALRVEGLATDTVIERLATVLRTLHAQPLDVPAVNIADRVRADARERQSDDPRTWPRARPLLHFARLFLYHSPSSLLP